MSLFTYTYFSQTYVQTVSFDGFGCLLSACFSFFHPPPVYYMFPLYTFIPSHYFFFAVTSLVTLVTFTILSGLTPALASFLRPCFQHQITFHNFEFPNRSTPWGQPFRVRVF
jgi:hypothetical protein